MSRSFYNTRLVNGPRNRNHGNTNQSYRTSGYRPRNAKQNNGPPIDWKVILDYLSKSIGQDNNAPEAVKQLLTRTTATGNQQRTRNAAAPPFQELGNDLVRFVQVKHHLGNWTSLPEAINRKIDWLTRDLHPPNKTPELDKLYKEAADAFKSSITVSTVEHLKQGLAKVSAKLRSYTDTTGTEEAHTYASQRLQQRFGKKLSRDKLRDSLTEAFLLLGSADGPTVAAATAADSQAADESATASTTAPGLQNIVTWTVPKRTNPARSVQGTTVTVQLHNRFDALDNEADQEPEAVEEMEMQSPPTPAPKTGVKRRAQSPAETERAAPRPRVVTSPRETSQSQPQETREHATGTMEETNQKPVRVITTPRAGRNSLRLPPHGLDKPVLMVGDSNLKKWNKHPDHWSVISYPGCTLKEIADMVCKSWKDIPATLEYVCIAAGININDESVNALDETAASLKKLRDTAGDRAFVVQTLNGEGLTETHRDAIEAQNRKCRRVMGEEQYIPIGRPAFDVEYDNNHYTSETAEHLVSKLHAFFA